MKLNYLAASFATIAPSWQQFLTQKQAEKLAVIDQELTSLSQTETIYPPSDSILRALNIESSQCKVVILGQDPYHGEGEANGLAFAVNPNIKTPPSLRNIFKELAQEYALDAKSLGNELLEKWNQQNVMLLNATLTVLKDKANSLQYLGWSEITDAIIQEINQHSPRCVFILWGNYARSKKVLIDSHKHLILESVHPSPLSASRGFFGCNHFQLTNQFLISHNLAPIKWF
ncbi:MAG: uracil-DNA glycosylase [Proteobacteria bacterium]|nr:MAG: uracil-DNA glycosylase [Pseudomonadota bacterium]